MDDAHCVAAKVCRLSTQKNAKFKLNSSNFREGWHLQNWWIRPCFLSIGGAGSVLQNQEFAGYVLQVYKCVLVCRLCVTRQHQQRQLKHSTANGRGVQTSETPDSTKLSWWYWQSRTQLFVSPNETQLGIPNPFSYILNIVVEKHNQQRNTYFYSNWTSEIHHHIYI